MSNIQKRNQEVTSSLSNGSHRDASFQRPTVTTQIATQIDEWIVTNQSPSYHHSSYTIEDRNQIRDALEDELGCHHYQQNDQCCDNSTVDINWTAVHALLLQLGRYTSVNQQLPSNYQEDDPFGRIFITHLLACNPPMNCLDAALRVFPDAIGPNNPVAFFTACSNASQQTIAHMMQHVLQKHLPENEGNQHSCECPYPWILLPFISVEAAQIMLDMYPQGVWETSSTPFLTSDSCSYSPLDYILFSSAMTKRRDFDEAMWLKFKLILVTADKNYDNFSNGCEISPVHTLLDRVLACSDCLEDSERAQHILWLLQELRLSDEWVFQKQRLQFSMESLFPLHLLLSQKCIASSQPALVAARELCKIIIEADSLAVMHGISTDEALYPLHLAIENGWPCHDLLLSVWPESIEMPDPRTGLLPFQSASSPWPTPTWTNTTAPDMSLSIAFELLRANPTMAVSCATTDTAIMMESTPVAVASATVSGIV